MFALSVNKPLIGLPITDKHATKFMSQKNAIFIDLLIQYDKIAV